AGMGTFAEQTFTCVMPGSPKNQGFVRSDQTNYLHLDAGGQFIPVGENIGWHLNNVYLDYQNWLTKLSDNGGNFFRLWQCSWGLGIEWKNGTSGYAGLRKYKQTSAFYQDWLFDYCAERGIYIQLCLQNHGQVSSGVNPEWNDSPYNAVNGGPCANTWDFFTNATAKAHVKNRLRYIVARWGYARSIMNWELFNEVDWTDEFEQRKADVADWHLEMAAYLKSIDPYSHLVSTSYAHDTNDPALWNQPDIDFTQTHYYINTPNLERVLASGIRTYLSDFGKPTMTGEFGLSPSGGELSTLDPNGIHLHNSLWGALFGGSMGSGMSWWWDNYIDPQNLYYHFGPVSTVAQSIPFQTSNLSPAAATISGAPADLSLTPTQTGWGDLADTSFTIQQGAVVPAGAALGSFLYGSQWNTQFRRPPTFHVTYPINGQFKVRTGGDSGQGPKIAIWVDGVKVLEQAAQTNQTYSVNVAAGTHTIKVDNTGTDWVSMASYSFTGLGTAVDAYVLKSENQNKLAGWLLNNRYNHEYVKANGLPPVATATLLQVPNVQNGTYLTKYYDCLTGALLSAEPVTVSNGTLNLNLPDLLWDAAFLVDDLPVGIAELDRHLAFQVSPNPAAPGLPLTLDFNTAQSTPLVVSLLDMEGRTLQSLFTGDTAAGQQQLRLSLPGDLPAGIYWLKMEGENGRVGTKAVAVGRP
ncbi:MAG: T9SS type A sorting domain-containing protein, partial [Saprospiraceae bacterium]|nr:T9SS type A sorting domain-containing protein [Saprospiraceae bacterium]